MEQLGEIETTAEKIVLPSGDLEKVYDYEDLVFDDENGLTVRGTQEVIAAGRAVMGHVLEMVGRAHVADMPLGSKYEGLKIADYLQVAYAHPGGEEVERKILTFASMDPGDDLEAERVRMGIIIDAYAERAQS